MNIWDVILQAFIVGACVISGILVVLVAVAKAADLRDWWSDRIHQGRYKK